MVMLGGNKDKLVPAAIADEPLKKMPILVTPAPGTRAPADGLAATRRGCPNL
jgi:hypothetical protein